MNQEIRSITNEGELARNEWENNYSDFLRAHVYKKIRTIFFHTVLAINCSVTTYKYFKNLISEV